MRANLAGDNGHVGVDSVIADAASGLTIRHVTTSPITNEVSTFHPPLHGRLNERYTYTHTLLDDAVHNYCMLDLALGADGRVAAKVELVGVPEPGDWT